MSNKRRELAPSELGEFFEQLTMYFRSAISTWESLSIICENAMTRKQRLLAEILYNDVSDGLPFSKAMKNAGCFPEYAIGMVELGEQSGRMEEVVEALSTYYKRRDVMSRSIRSAITYPLLMAGMVLAVVFVLIVNVMPVFEQVFAQLGLVMNPFSQALLDFGRILSENSQILLMIVGVLLVLFILIKVTPPGRAFSKSLYEHSAFTRKLSYAENANRFAFSLSLMLASGIDPLRAFDFVSELVSKGKIRSRIRVIKEHFESGEALTDALIASSIFDSAYNGIITASVRAASVDEMLMSIADRYQLETERRLTRLLGIIEPMLVAIMCLLVGMIMLSVMLPLTSILTNMQ